MKQIKKPYDLLVLGAGAAGLLCAGLAGQRGCSVLLIDHAKSPGEKIRISGGGRCNFTNVRSGPHAFLSANPHFCKSALARYTAQDFVDLVETYGIAYHEKTLGQLFCDGRSQAIIDLLLAELAKGGAELRLRTSLEEVVKADTGFLARLSDGTQVQAAKLVVATGGKSIPKMGASDLGYRLARQFGLAVRETRPALVPFMLPGMDALSGVSLPVAAQAGKGKFEEALLFTHRGLSGPAMLQVSSYWREGEGLRINLLPGEDLEQAFVRLTKEQPATSLPNALAILMPRRLAQEVCEELGLEMRLADLSRKQRIRLIERLQAWQPKPAGTEGYRTAEVTLGGVDTAALSSTTLEARQVPGLYFIGEVVDVTGWLGGYNFQWAWSSAHAAAMAV